MDLTTHGSVLGQTIREPLDRPEAVRIPSNVRHITMTSDEFTSLCPVTGQPDFSTVRIDFQVNPETPATLESKSLKLYLLKFRNQGVFCEALAAQIAMEISEVLKSFVHVRVTQKPRGGIEIIAEATWNEEV